MRNNSFFKVTLAVFLAVFSSTAAMGQSPSGEDLPGELSGRIKLHGYAQGGYSYSQKGEQIISTFELKRVLFWADAQITDRWSFLFMHDFSSVVQEYYTEYRFTNNKALTVRLGQFKNGLSIENPLSPTSLEAIDVCSEGVVYLAGCGSDPLYGVQYGRDLGLSLYGETSDARFAYRVDVLNGQGINKKDGNNDKDFIGRLEYRPLPGLSLVASGQLGRGHAIAASLYNPAILPGENYTRNRLTAGIEYKSSKGNLRAEYLEGKDGDAVSRGAYLTGSVPIWRGFDLVGSYDFFNYNTALGLDQHKVIAGFQYWYYKKCRLQLQYVYKSAYTDAGRFVHGASHALMLQMQVRFDYTGQKKNS